MLVKGVQAIKHRWRCNRCGEGGTSQNLDPNHLPCPACYATSTDWFEFLEPAGFAADLREKPHADADVVTFVPPEPTRVSARGAPWLSLFDPTRGRRRADPDGAVFYCNAGPTGDGYDICLYCGRAGYDPGEPHRPLIGKTNPCEGSAKPFARKDGLRLGHEIRTDVFEFQPAGWPERGRALALGIALREALARKLGVDADEMGISAEPRLDAMSGQTMSILLHDKASGGAGFSVKAQDLFADLIIEAEEILDCKVEGCVRGCPSCVLIGNLTDEEVDRLDRRPALTLVRERLLADAAPADEDRVSGDARFSIDTLDELHRALEAGGDQAVLYVAGPIDPASLEAWPAASHAKLWASRGRTVILALERGAVDQLNGAQRLQLRDQLNRWGIALEEGDQRSFPNGARLVAEVRRPTGPALAFASRDAAAWSASSTWGEPDTAPLVRFEASLAWRGLSIDLGRLRESPGAILIDLRSEVDGPISGFGERLATIIGQMLAGLGVTATDEVVEITYEDRYLKSPATARLCLDTLSKLKRSSTSPVPVRTSTFPLEPSNRPMQWLDNDWRRDGDRLAAMKFYGAAQGLKLSIQLTHPEHGRRLALHYRGGRVAEILFDQGFGAWRNDRGVAFDFSRAAADQAKRLAALHCGVRVPPGARTYLVANIR
jgi:DEAD/DEAH box helicase domain-containing protein